MGSRNTRIWDDDRHNSFSNWDRKRPSKDYNITNQLPELDEPYHNIILTVGTIKKSIEPFECEVTITASLYLKKWMIGI